jgi:hypothetical protein
MVVPKDKQQEGDNYYGDSGAWIIRDSDNALVGLLWGWINGQLIFTPITDVFADIKDTLNATEVCLPGLSTAPNPDGLTVSVAARRTCRIKEQGPRKPKSYYTQVPRRSALVVPNNQPPRAEPISISSPVDLNKASTKKADSVAIVMDAVKDRSPSPVPSLGFSISSSSGTVSRCSPALELESQSGCISDEPAVTIREDSDAEGSSDVDEELQSNTPLQHLLKQGHRKSQHENRLSLDFILENANLTKVPSETLHERLERSSGTWPSAETWRRAQEIASS